FIQQGRGIVFDKNVRMIFSAKKTVLVNNFFPPKGLCHREFMIGNNPASFGIHHCNVILPSISHSIYRGRTMMDQGLLITKCDVVIIIKSDDAKRTIIEKE